MAQLHCLCAAPGVPGRGLRHGVAVCQQAANLKFHSDVSTAKEATSAAKASAAETQQQHREAEAAHCAAQTTLEQVTAEMTAARRVVDTHGDNIKSLNARRGAAPPPLPPPSRGGHVCILRLIPSFIGWHVDVLVRACPRCQCDGSDSLDSCVALQTSR